MKLLKLLFLIRSISKSQGYSPTCMGNDLLGVLYLELEEHLAFGSDVDKEEMESENNG